MDAAALATTIVTIFLFLALCAALALTTIALRRPSAAPILVAAGLVTLCLIVVAVLPWKVPVLAVAVLALLITALAVLGGNPLVRWVLRIADGSRTPEGPRGGILVEMMAEPPGAGAHEEEILRGGTTIGYLERLACVLSIFAGFPAAIAVIVALKGVGRFTELATPAARERFIVGTMASLLWACSVAAVVPLTLR